MGGVKPAKGAIKTRYDYSLLRRAIATHMGKNDLLPLHFSFRAEIVAFQQRAEAPSGDSLMSRLIM